MRASGRPLTTFSNCFCDIGGMFVRFTPCFSKFFFISSFVNTSGYLRHNSYNSGSLCRRALTTLRIPLKFPFLLMSSRMTLSHSSGFEHASYLVLSTQQGMRMVEGLSCLRTILPMFWIISVGEFLGSTKTTILALFVSIPSPIVLQEESTTTWSLLACSSFSRISFLSCAFVDASS